MKRIGVKKQNRSFSLPATLGFLLLAAGFVVGCVLVVSGMLGPQQAEQPVQEPRIPVLEASVTPEPGSEVSAIRVPEDGRLPMPVPSPSSTDTPPPQTAAATPTPMPAVSAPEFSDERMDFMILGFDAAHSADVICVVSVNGKNCTVLSLPRNTLTGDGGVLCEADTPARAFTGVRNVFPVYLRQYIEMDLDGLANCIDALGGIRLEAEQKSGREACAYLEAGGSDELLRITRQQTLLHAMVVQMREMGLLRLLPVKRALQKCTDGNLTTGQYMALYNALRRLDTDQIRFLTLPVDSVVRGGTRFYEADRPLSEALARELFLPAD